MEIKEKDYERFVDEIMKDLKREDRGADNVRTRERKSMQELGAYANLVNKGDILEGIGKMSSEDIFQLLMIKYNFGFIEGHRSGWDKCLSGRIKVLDKSKQQI